MLRLGIVVCAAFVAGGVAIGDCVPAVCSLYNDSCDEVTNLIGIWDDLSQYRVDIDAVADACIASLESLEDELDAALEADDNVYTHGGWVSARCQANEITRRAYWYKNLADIMQSHLDDIYKLVSTNPDVYTGALAKAKDFEENSNFYSGWARQAGAEILLLYEIVDVFERSAIDPSPGFTTIDDLWESAQYNMRNAGWTDNLTGPIHSESTQSIDAICGGDVYLWDVDPSYWPTHHPRSWETEPLCEAVGPDPFEWPVSFAPSVDYTDEWDQLKVDVTANGDSLDDIYIESEGTGTGEISVSGSTISYEGTSIGTFTGGNGTNALVVTFDGDETDEAIKQLLRSVRYESSSTYYSTATKTVQFDLKDKDGNWISDNVSFTLELINRNNAPGDLRDNDFRDL